MTMIGAGITNYRYREYSKSQNLVLLFLLVKVLQKVFKGG